MSEKYIFSIISQESNLPTYGINVYKFAMIPEEHMSKSSSIMSQIYNSSLIPNINTNDSSTIRVFG